MLKTLIVLNKENLEKLSESEYFLKQYLFYETHTKKIWPTSSKTLKNFFKDIYLVELSLPCGMQA